MNIKFMSKSLTRSATYTQPSAQGLFDVGGEYLADMLKQQGNNLGQDLLTNSLHSRNQQPQIGQLDIPLSDSSINWMKDKFKDQNATVGESTTPFIPDFSLIIQSETHQMISEVQLQRQSVHNDLSKSIVTPEIFQVLKDMGFYIPDSYATSNMSVDELKEYCNLYSSSFDNECITEILGALIG